MLFLRKQSLLEAFGTSGGSKTTAPFGRFGRYAQRADQASARGETAATEAIERSGIEWLTAAAAPTPTRRVG